LETVEVSEDKPVGSFFVMASCPAGKKAVGGGHRWFNGQVTGTWIWLSHPTSGNAGWIVQGFVESAGSRPTTVTAYAICASAG
jgi:hypothetical protein